MVSLANVLMVWLQEQWSHHPELFSSLYRTLTLLDRCDLYYYCTRVARVLLPCLVLLSLYGVGCTLGPCMKYGEYVPSLLGL